MIGGSDVEKEKTVTAPTLYDIAHQKGMKTAAIAWPATRGASTLDWIVPMAYDAELRAPHTTPELLTYGKPLPGYEEFHDDWRTEVFIHLLKTHRPQLVFIHLSWTDKIQHEHGPNTEEAYRELHAADGRVGKIWETLKSEFPGEATLFVTADHGFAAPTKKVKYIADLQKAGLISTDKTKPGSIVVAGQGGCSFLYIMDKKNSAKVQEEALRILQDSEDVHAVVAGAQNALYGIPAPHDDAKAPDIVVFNKEEYGNPKGGSHGYFSGFPNLKAMCIAWGNGIEAGSVVDSVDARQVAPTAAALMGLRLPDPAGKPIGEFLSKK